MCPLITTFFIIGTLFSTIARGETKGLSLNQAVVIGFRNNQNYIPLAKIDYESSLQDYNGQNPRSLDYSSTIAANAQNNGDSLHGVVFSMNQTENASLVNALSALSPLPTGGSGELGLSAPMSVNSRYGNKDASIPISLSGKISQPLFPSDIGAHKLEFSIYRDMPRRLKKAYVTSLEEYILKLAQSYFPCADVKAQRKRIITEIARVKDELDIAKIKKRSGAISEVELKAAQLTLMQLELNEQSVEIKERKAKEQFVDLLGTPIDDSIVFSGVDTMHLEAPSLDSITTWYFNYDENLRDMEKSKRRSEFKKSAFSLFSPSLEINGSYTPFIRQWNKSDTMQIGKNYSPWSISAIFTGTLISGRQMRINRRKAELDLRRTEIQIKDAKTSLERQARDLFYDAIDMQQRMQAAQVACQSSKQVFEMERQKFLLGEISRIELEQHADNNETNARTLEAAKTDFIILQLKIMQIKGGLLSFFNVQDNSSW